MHKFAMLKQSVRMSIQNIKSNKMRSFLTTLGIIIGVTAVIALITIVSGVSGYMMNSFSSMGAGKLTVSAPGTYLKQGLSESDIEALASLDNVAGVSPSVSVSTKIVYGREVHDKISVSGKNAIYFLNNDTVSSGRALRQTDMRGDVYVCVIDEEGAKTLFAGRNPLG
ncbi:MAG: ABC transporter permease, partial [Oscillospiraceae bacterium]